MKAEKRDAVSVVEVEISDVLWKRAFVTDAARLAGLWWRLERPPKLVDEDRSADDEVDVVGPGTVPGPAPPEGPPVPPLPPPPPTPPPPWGGVVKLGAVKLGVDGADTGGPGRDKTLKSGDDPSSPVLLPPGLFERGFFKTSIMASRSHLQGRSAWRQSSKLPVDWYSERVSDD